MKPQLKRPTHYLKVTGGREPNRSGTTWCGKFMDLASSRGRWTEIFSQSDCYPCVAAVHKHHKALGGCAMRDHRSRRA